MYSEQELESTLKEIRCRIDDTRTMFPEYESSRVLYGMMDQIEFLLDVLKETNLLVYGYHRYEHEINSKLIEDGEDVTNGKLRVNDFAHMVISMDELFDGFPCEEAIQNRSLKLSLEDFARDIA